MSALRERLKRPETYLAMVVATIAFLCADAFRDPNSQWTGRGYVAAVHFYQHHVSAKLRSRVQCRFEPTCSHYSEEAVSKYGIGRGLKMTASRLWRCRSNVPLGTKDPVSQIAQTTAMVNQAN